MSIKVKVVHILDEYPLMLVQHRQDVFVIAIDRHALDEEGEHNLADFTPGDTCYIDEWYLCISKKDYNKLPKL